MLNKSNNKRIVTCMVLCISIIAFVAHRIMTEPERLTLKSIQLANIELRDAIDKAPLFAPNQGNRLYNSPTLNRWHLKTSKGLEIAEAHASTFPSSKPLLNTIDLCQQLKEWIYEVIEKNRINPRAIAKMQNLINNLHKHVNAIKDINFQINATSKKNAKKTCIIIGTSLNDIGNHIILAAINQKNRAGITETPTKSATATISREEFNRKKAEYDKKTKKNSLDDDEEAWL